MTDPPPELFTSFTSGRNREVNKKTARRSRDIYARSLRSLRSVGRAPRVRAPMRVTPLLSNTSERSERSEHTTTVCRLSRSLPATVGSEQR